MERADLGIYRRAHRRTRLRRSYPWAPAWLKINRLSSRNCPSLRSLHPKGYVLSARPAGHLLIALGFPGAAAPTGIAETQPFALRHAGPQTWLIVGDARIGPQELAERERQLGGAVALVSQTHGRARIEISGVGAARRLTAEVAVDLSPLAFPEGASCNTLCGHIAVHLTRTGPESFEIIVGRSFAGDLWHSLAA